MNGRTMLGWWSAAFLLPLAVSVFAQDVLTARDAFWSASDLITVAPNPAAHSHKARAHPSSPAQNSHEGIASSTETRSSSETPNVGKAVLISESGYGAAPHLDRSAEHRLGLRCSLLARGPDGQYAEVSPSSVFHSGDHIRLSLLANEPGYLYVIAQGSSGAWKAIFPSAASPADANKIRAGEVQQVPGGTGAFQFDETPGEEKLFVIFSRTPVGDIDRAIQSLRGDRPAPAAEPSGGEVLTAENQIPSFFVHQLAIRDLTLVDEQKVDDSSSREQHGEKAIYVVSKPGNPDASSRVVLSLDLRHQ